MNKVVLPAHGGDSESLELSGGYKPTRTAPHLGPRMTRKSSCQPRTLAAGAGAECGETTTKGTIMSANALRCPRPNSRVQSASSLYVTTVSRGPPHLESHCFSIQISGHSCLAPYAFGASHTVTSSMVFGPPAWVPRLAAEIPGDLSIEQIMLDDKYGRQRLDKSLNPYTCGLTGKTYTIHEVKDRVDALARGLSKELAFEVNEGTEFDKVIAAFSVNTVSRQVSRLEIGRSG